MCVRYNKNSIYLQISIEFTWGLKINIYFLTLALSHANSVHTLPVLRNLRGNYGTSFAMRVLEATRIIITALAVYFAGNDETKYITIPLY